jgi:hypothetical protein
MRFSRLVGLFLGMVQAGVAEFVDGVAVAAGGGMGGHAADLADLVEGELVPDFEDNSLALIGGEVGEGADGGGFIGVGFVAGFEPGAGLEFAGEAAPKAAVVIEGAVAVAAGDVMERLGWGLRAAEELEEGVLEDILGFAVGEA